MAQVSYAEALNHRPSLVEGRAAATPQLKHIEVVHHMTGGEPHVSLVEPGKMAEHVASCLHCGGGSAESE